jgi:cyanophycinase
MPIGGAEDHGLNNGDGILLRFLKIAGGKRARIVVIPTASEDPEETGDGYVKLFQEIGASEAVALQIQDRADANAGPALEQLERATGVYITGGDQARLVAYLAGTAVMETIRLRNAQGVIVAGTSAGASILASHMVVGGTGLNGNSNDATARKGMIELMAGFGLLQDVIIDQHFSQRGRIGRLFSAFAANPGLIGLGLDEDTAALVTNDGTLEVLGSGSVTIIDGRQTTSDYFERDFGDVLTVLSSSFYVLGPTRCFDLDSRRPLPWESEPAVSEPARR